MVFGDGSFYEGIFKHDEISRNISDKGFYIDPIGNMYEPQLANDYPEIAKRSAGFEQKPSNYQKKSNSEQIEPGFKDL
jgi:hypothetical protein